MPLYWQSDHRLRHYRLVWEPHGPHYSKYEMRRWRHGDLRAETRLDWLHAEAKVLEHQQTKAGLAHAGFPQNQKSGKRKRKRKRKRRKT